MGLIEWLSYIPIALFIIYAFKNPEKIELWSSIITRVFSRFSKKAERHSISADIQSRLSSYIKNYSVEGVLPYGIKFKWVDKGNFESYVEEGDVIVIMDKHENNSRNFLNAIVAYTSQALFPKVRQYLPSDFLIASELLVQEKLIREKRPDALTIFKNEIEPERIKSLTGIKKMKEKLDSMDKSGYFETVLLPEVTHASPRLQELTTNEITVEVHSFVTYLEQIVNRKPGDESHNLWYDGKSFHVAIILIAKHFKMLSEGIKPYLNRALSSLRLVF